MLSPDYSSVKESLSGCKMQDTRCRYRAQDARCRMPEADAGFRMPDEDSIWYFPFLRSGGNRQFAIGPRNFGGNPLNGCHLVFVSS